MVHEDYKEMIPARALSALDAAEAHALNEHLENCAECRRELDEWEATAAALALGANATEPSPQVRERILDEVRKDLEVPKVVPFLSSPRNLWSSFGPLGAMAAVVLFTALLVGLAVLWRQNNEYRAELAKSREFVELVQTPGAMLTELKATDAGGSATAKIVYDQTGRAILFASKLPRIPQGKAYQLWFIVGDKPPIPGKTFLPDSNGDGVSREHVPSQALVLATFAITVEPAVGSTTPTSPIYLSSPNPITY